MLQNQKDGTVSLTVSPFVKVVLTVIAAALCIIALRGFIGPEPLYAQAGYESVDVYVKSLPGGVNVTVSPEWGGFPVEVKGYVEVRDY
ncbi:MAG: hypothetical protein JSW52_11150 [Candidatus Coatesbacteria bacterium]|nr:MAG: hypothetical protein JSW52_11150 [Candidatus Coatesbacteria bacterium]